MAVSTWVRRSGEGVTAAARMKTRRMAYFLCFAIIFASTTPILARRTKTTGNSKTRPKASKNFIVNVKYSFMLGIGLIKSEANPKRNRNPTGIAT